MGNERNIRKLDRRLATGKMLQIVKSFCDSHHVASYLSFLTNAFIRIFFLHVHVPRFNYDIVLQMQMFYFYIYYFILNIILISFSYSYIFIFMYLFYHL